MSYLNKRTIKETISIMVQLSKVCQKLGGPLTNQLFCLMRDHRFQELVNFQFDYTWKFDPNDFLYARQIQALVAKQDFLDFGIDKQKVAMDKFLTAELRCRETNIRIETTFPEWDVGGVLYTAQRKICSILKDVPSIDTIDLKFGPGATTSTKSTEACNRAKLSASLECSANLLPLIRDLLTEIPVLAYFNSTGEDDESFTTSVNLANGKVAFVPKDCKTDRTIVVEPVLNGLIQKGIGTIMKSRLSHAGCDLHQQTRNQKLAQKGSIDGSLATVDLVSASDTVSRALVWSLLPYDWACLLDYCRSEAVVMDGEVIVLEKFSSMGNAYTFELESLIFYSLALSCCSQLGLSTENVSVYGDDIIIPVAAYDLLERVLTYCGFEINIKKSFMSGPFRESCGADYFSGLDIRPFYLKEILSDRVLYVMHNWFMRSCEFELAKVAHNCTHTTCRLYGPDGFGDGHLIGPFKPRLDRKSKRAGYSGGFFDTYTLKAKPFKRLLPGDFMYPAYSIYVRGEPSLLEPGTPCEPNIVRGTCGYKRISIYTLANGIFIR